MKKKVVMLLGMLLGFNPVVFSETRVSTSDLPNAEILRTTEHKDSELQLNVRQMPLVQVLKELIAKTKTPIHYTVLPEGLITATCVGSSLKTVLECLLDRKADIIVRYRHENTGKAMNNPIAEAWILGAKLEALPNSALCKTESDQGTMEISAGMVDPGIKSNPSDLLLKIAQTGNPQDRTEAIGNLLTIGAQNDPKIKAFLEAAVHDKNPEVRAQAVSTLTHRVDYNEKAPQIIQEALQDSSVDVRLMAVDAINDDVGLLQQAVNDSDETVRVTASLKLEQLMKQEVNNK